MKRMNVSELLASMALYVATGENTIEDIMPDLDRERCEELMRELTRLSPDTEIVVGRRCEANMFFHKYSEPKIPELRFEQRRTSPKEYGMKKLGVRRRWK